MIYYLIFDQTKKIKKESYFESYEFSNFNGFFLKKIELLFEFILNLF